MDDSRISHLSYIGDSLIAEGCNIGAGTITANLRLDEKSIRMKIKEAPVDSGRKKLGVILGDRVKTGIQVCLMPGVKVGCDSIIGPNTTISEDIPPNKLVKTEDRVKIVDLID
jgi:bifunctional UDP-N-acetylglucosamine pyrophosphorylase/glucosamine-1-phosphate N-acetyltransferase